MNALQFCHYGGIELVDERCNTAGVCGKQSVRLAWDRGSGVLFEGDSTGEKEQRRIGTPELERLLADITGLDALVTDADVPAGTWRVHERAMTVSTNCSDSLSTFTFLGAKPAWERVRDAQADCAGPWSTEHANCVARTAWQAAFATHLATRFGTAFHHLRDAGRGG